MAGGGAHAVVYRHMEAVRADGRLLAVELQTLPLHLTLASDESEQRRDMRITIPFAVVTGCNDVKPFGDKTMKECLGLDVGRLVKEEIM